jgi:hypothetical protein
MMIAIFKRRRGLLWLLSFFGQSIHVTLETVEKPLFKEMLCYPVDKIFSSRADRFLIFPVFIFEWCVTLVPLLFFLYPTANSGPKCTIFSMLWTIQ